MLLKKGLMSFAIALPLVSTMAAAHNYNSIDALRQRCFDLRHDTQIRPFNIKMLCSGSYSYWEKERGEYALPGQSSIFTQTTCKGGRFDTGEGAFALELQPYVGSCDRYVKKEMLAPEGVGIAINLERCEDLFPETVEALCRDQVHSYCNDQFVFDDNGFRQGDSSSSSSSSSAEQAYGHEGVCTLRVVEVIDTCSTY